jgi:hypothetical protein
MDGCRDIENHMVLEPEPPELPPIGNCPQCGEPVLPGEDIAVIPDHDVATHWECLDEYLIKSGIVQIRVATSEDKRLFE